MKDILAYVEGKKANYARAPFFDFLRDLNIPPQQRLAFAPSFAFFVMGFGELNKHAFRQEPATDEIQAIINHHTYEDDSHWAWFLEDLEKLGANQSMSFSKMLEFLWSQENNFSRWTTYRLYQLTHQASPIQKLVVIEAIEATAEIFLDLTSKISEQIKSDDATVYKYFGQHHFNIDSNHTMHSDEAEHKVEDIIVPEDFKARAYELVDEVFSIFTAFSDALLQYSISAIESQVKATVPAVVVEK